MACDIGGILACSATVVVPLSSNASALRWRWLLPVAVLVVAFHLSPFSAALDRAFYDIASRHPWRTPPVPTNSAIVLIDDETMGAIGHRLPAMRWPFPRMAFAGLIAALDRAGAAKIVVDFTFLEPSEAMEQDQLLAGVAGVTRTVVLARKPQQEPVFWDAVFRAAHPQLFAYPRTGDAVFEPDEDGIVRHYTVADSLAGVAFGAASGQTGGLLRWRGSTATLAGGGKVPVLSATRFLVRGFEIMRRLVVASPDLTLEQLGHALAAEPALTGDPIFAAVRGRVVFVGANASGTFDLKPTPMGKLESGTLVQWTAWSNLTANDFIRALPRWLSLALALLTGCVILLAAFLRPGIAVPGFVAIGFVMVLLPVAYGGLSAGAFLGPATPSAAAILMLLGVVAENFWSERRRKREIQAMFGSYVAPEIVDLLVRDPTAIRLGGEKRNATVFFCDLAGFTDLSEQVSPEELLELINTYLQETSDCLMAHGAYIDKYIGDAVMAVFGAPMPRVDHAVAACRAALGAQRLLVDRNKQLAISHGRTLGMRIGINTGEMIVGNVGSERKRNYTVLGDAVNLASRLEGANKEFGTSILVSETTARLVKDELVLRPLTALRVKGKQTAVRVFELVGAPNDLTPAQNTFLAKYGEGHRLYSARRFAEGMSVLAEAAALVPTDEMTQHLLSEAARFAQSPPAADWEPILSLKTK
jgi:adenylate cyclase